MFINAYSIGRFPSAVRSEWGTDKWQQALYKHDFSATRKLGKKPMYSSRIFIPRVDSQYLSLGNSMATPDTPAVCLCFKYLQWNISRLLRNSIFASTGTAAFLIGSVSKSRDWASSEHEHHYTQWFRTQGYWTKTVPWQMWDSFSIDKNSPKTDLVVISSLEFTLSVTKFISVLTVATQGITAITTACTSHHETLKLWGVLDTFSTKYRVKQM